MRVRISFDALRLCALVAAGATSGYLWRAAFESSTPEVRVAATPRVVHPAPAPKVVRIPPSRVAPHKAVAHHVARRAQRVTPAAASLASHPAAVTPVRTVPVPEASPQPSTPKPQPKPQPKPAPAPSPATPTPSAPVASPPAPTQTTTVQAAAAPPAAPAQEPQKPENQPNLGNSTSDTRPGWGKGDKNHDHTGPGSGP
jgi:hypothetical protein